MPAPEYPARCFICGELAEAFDLSGDQIGVQLVGEDRIVFFAHHECMRTVASPAFPFPSQEDLDEQGRELVELWRDELGEEADADARTETVPELEDVYPDLRVTEQLLAALARDDDEAIDALRESTDADWWNVVWTLALLLRGLRAGEPATVALVDSLMGDEPDAAEADSAPQT